MTCLVDCTNYLIIKDFGGDFERHHHSSFGDQVRNQLGTTIEDCATHQKIHLKTN